MSAKEKYQQCVRNVREGATKEEKLARLEELYGVVKGFSEQENAEILANPMMKSTKQLGAKRQRTYPKHYGLPSILLVWNFKKPPFKSNF